MNADCFSENLMEKGWFETGQGKFCVAEDASFGLRGRGALGKEVGVRRQRGMRKTRWTVEVSGRPESIKWQGSRSVQSYLCPNVGEQCKFVNSR